MRSLLSLLSISAWEDVFDNNERKKKIVWKENAIEISGNGNYYISYSSINNFVLSKECYGAISIYNVPAKLLIEYSFINNIYVTSSDNAGTIYFNSNQNGEFALNTVCGTECFLENNIWALFLRVVVHSSAINQYNMSSICKCGNSTDIGKCVNNIENGNIIVDGVNSSNNIAYQHSGIDLENPLVQARASFCFFGNDTSYGCICNNYLESTLLSYFVFVDNIVHSAGILVSMSSVVTISNSVFIGNTKGRLFHLQDGISITVIRCFYDDATSSGAAIENPTTLFVVQHNHGDFSYCKDLMKATNKGCTLKRQSTSISFVFFMVLISSYQ